MARARAGVFRSPVGAIIFLLFRAEVYEVVRVDVRLWLLYGSWAGILG